MILKVPKQDDPMAICHCLSTDESDVKVLEKQPVALNEFLTSCAQTGDRILDYLNVRKHIHIPYTKYLSLLSIQINAIQP